MQFSFFSSERHKCQTKKSNPHNKLENKIIQKKNYMTCGNETKLSMLVFLFVTADPTNTQDKFGFF